MRSLLAPLILAVAGCATSSTESTQTPTVRPACDQRTDCFRQRAVRNFRVLNNTSLVVFVGSARCPYLVNVEGFFCSLRSSAYLNFQDFDGRICSLDRSYIVGNPFLGEEEYCQIRSVDPLNDDELVEIYAAYGLVEPLPATGSGELEVIKPSEEERAVPVSTGPNSPDVTAETS